MIKWIVFAVVAICWIGVCWFFGSMVALTHAGPKASAVQSECAYRQLAAAERSGRTLDIMDARFSPECKAAHAAVMKREAWPYQRNGLLTGFLPALLVGGLIYWRSRS